MRTIISATAACLAIATGPALAQDGDMAFGTEDDISYAELLWDLMDAGFGNSRTSISVIPGHAFR